MLLILKATLFVWALIFGGLALNVGAVTNLENFENGVFFFKQSKEYVELLETTYPELNIFCHNGKVNLFLLEVFELVIYFTGILLIW